MSLVDLNIEECVSTLFQAASLTLYLKYIRMCPFLLIGSAGTLTLFSVARTRALLIFVGL